MKVKLTDPIPLRDIEVKGFFTRTARPSRRSVFQRCGIGDGNKIPFWDDIGTPYLTTNGDQLVYPVPREVALELWEVRPK